MNVDCKTSVGYLTIFFCFVGCAGLFVLAKVSNLVSIHFSKSTLLTHGVQWNCYDYPTVHWDGTLVFIIGVALSAIFQTLEVVRILRMSVE